MGARCTSVMSISRTPVPIPALPVTRREWTRTSPLYSWRTPLGKRVCISHEVQPICPYDGTPFPVSLHYSSDWTLIVYKVQITLDNNRRRCNNGRRFPEAWYCNICQQFYGCIKMYEKIIYIYIYTLLSLLIILMHPWIKVTPEFWTVVYMSI